MIVISIKGEPAADRSNIVRQVLTLLQTAGKVVRYYKDGAPETLPDCHVAIIEDSHEQ